MTFESSFHPCKEQTDIITAPWNCSFFFQGFSDMSHLTVPLGCLLALSPDHHSSCSFQMLTVTYCIEEMVSAEQKTLLGNDCVDWNIIDTAASFCVICWTLVLLASTWGCSSRMEPDSYAGPSIWAGCLYPCHWEWRKQEHMCMSTRGPAKVESCQLRSVCTTK